MGKFSSVEKFINTNVDIQKQLRENNPYSRFINGVPTFVTYYAINGIETTLDEGFRDTEDLIGDDSSIRYNKIEKFPIWGIENLTIDITDEEYGPDIEVNGEGIILPNTITPCPDDYLIINYLGKDYLFRVTNFDSDTIKSSHYYKIQFEFKQINDGNIDNQVKDIFVSIYENIGTDYKVIISLDSNSRLEVIERKDSLLREMYMDLFFSKKTNSVILPSYMRYTNIYDNFLVHFIYESSIFQDDREIFPYYFESIEDVDKSIFNRTIYGAILFKSKKNLGRYSHVNITSPHNKLPVLTGFREQYNFINFYSTPLEICTEYISGIFIDNILNNTLYDDDSHKLENIIIKYLNDTDIPLYDFENLDINDFYNNSKDTFLYVPLVLYVIKTEIFNILLNTNTK